ncbi:unnamed protein product [Malus baccata var. baccata]
MILPGLATLAPSPDFITVKCGKEIHDAIFQPRDADQVSLPCCRRLQKMGHDCRKALVDRALQAPLSKVEKLQTQINSWNIWRGCFPTAKK